MIATHTGGFRWTSVRRFVTHSGALIDPDGTVRRGRELAAGADDAIPALRGT